MKRISRGGYTHICKKRFLYTVVNYSKPRLKATQFGSVFCAQRHTFRAVLAADPVFNTVDRPHGLDVDYFPSERKCVQSLVFTK